MTNEFESQHQHDFVFADDKGTFVPVSRDQIFGADYLIKQIEPYVQLMQKSDPTQEESSSIGHMLFSGESGTGKTYLARYIAGSAAAHFVNANDFPRKNSAAGWLKEDIGALWSLCRQYVQEKRQYVIIFFDQFEEFFDSATRNGAIGQFYSELDGLTGKFCGIMVVAATTRFPHLFDAQLLRPGRLNINLQFELPTHRGMADLLRFYLSQKRHESFDIEKLAPLLPRKTPAVITELVSLAYFNASVRTRIEAAQLSKPVLPTITEKDFLQAVITTELGRPGAEIDEMPPEKIFIFAVREAGYALVAHELGYTVKFISMPSTTWCMGRTHTGIDLRSPHGARDEMVMTFGRCLAVEMLGLENLVSNADFDRVTKFANSLVMGLCEGKHVRRKFGYWVETDGNRQKTQYMLSQIETDVAEHLKETRAQAGRILWGIGRRRIHNLASFLQNRQLVFQDELEPYFRETE